MNNFWEKAFSEKHKMWGDHPTISSIETARYSKTLNYKEVLIPGFGYGRNAVPFMNAGINISGIEVSETAIGLARENFGQSVKIFQGSVDEMPFEDKKYDGIYCHALIHLLDAQSRAKFLRSCFDQIRVNGTMVFTTITKSASTYGVGQAKEPDQYHTKDGLEIFFYDADSIENEFAQFGKIGKKKICEPVRSDSEVKTEFWVIEIAKDS